MALIPWRSASVTDTVGEVTRAQRILATPRGRFLCANVAFRHATGDRGDQYRRPRTLIEVQSAIRSVDIEGLVAADESEFLGALGYAVDFARYWQPPDKEDILYAASEVVTLLTVIAESVSRHPACAWWDDPIDPELQRMIAYPFGNEAFPESTLPYRSDGVRWDEWRAHIDSSEKRCRQEYQRHPHRALSGEWWSTPYAAGTAQTTRARPGLGAVQLIAEEDTSIGDEARVWAVSVAERARVYEIGAPGDWARLVDRYPLEVTASRKWDWYNTTGRHRRWYMPDWEAVADDHDAVHVSVNGYLSSAGIEIPLATRDGATVLAGWGPDVTWWLDPDAMRIDDVPVLWFREDERWCASPAD
ncbi:hypothetical protein GOTRE_175_01440 [Gordonia terrae NBRC 100016]|uniref:Uncharacterized protein n=1 Tax=Gordonia terrae NBRC 100016 TaxID=1089454 RepID=A0ABQ0HL97_9ACTN|nr:hypothetical protein GOTRE_175_01440 [Gordonia terrae NBRC 100016]VTR11256.1 Uncharacterised protein [Clostridioides difficile]VTS59424.1 Uncharacterised protein [Gordonia terrae]